MTYRILVSGSRTWADYEAVEAAIVRVCAQLRAWEHPVIVHGDARGADRMATRVARLFGLETEVHQADWSNGRGAGYARNATMVKLGADVCLAFIRDRSKGATHCATLAEHAGIPVRIYRNDN